MDGLTLAFHPARPVVEQGDWVRWEWTGGSHTTTSGAICNVPSGLWDKPLNSISTQWTQQFTQAPPTTIDYFCNIPFHCPSGMRGTVVVTTLIDLTAKDSAGTLTLSWTGGSPNNSYMVFRSDNAAFTGVNTVKLPHDAGSTGTVFTDTLAPPAGAISFYLVMNFF